MIGVPDGVQVVLTDRGGLEVNGGRMPPMEAGVGGSSVQEGEGIGLATIIAVGAIG
jgi:hypothetical protein